MGRGKNGECPKCGSGWLTWRHLAEKWYCRACHHIFKTVAQEKPKAKGSGIVAPPAYRYGYRWKSTPRRSYG